MKLEQVVSRIGDFTEDCILITEAEPVGLPGPRIVWCNASFERMTGYTLDEIKGQTPRILQGPDTSNAARQAIRDGLTRWEPVRVELLNYDKAGQTFWVDLSIVPVADETGWFHYWVSVQRDVTARKEAELSLAARNTALVRAQERLHRERVEIEGIASVAEHARDFITITDPEFRIVWANPAFLEKVRFKLEDVVGLHHCDILQKGSAEYSSRQVAVRAIIDGRLRAEEVRNITRHGEEYWTDLSLTVQRDDNGRPTRFVVVERDVTEKRRLTEELRRHRDDLQALVEQRTATIQRQSEELAAALEAEKELSRLQRQFVSMVSHELRTPLSIIDGRAYILEARADAAGPELVRKSCATIRSAILRLTELMESVLQSSRLEQGDIEFSPDETDLAAIVADTRDYAAELFPGHHVVADLEGEMGAVWCDRTLIRQSISNLLSNAGKYSDPGSQISIRARRDAATQTIRISVTDAGVGIPPDEIDRLFSRFFRASTSVGRPGTGIGLHLVGHFVAMHGGTVSVESDLGVGSTFTITIPANRIAMVA